TKLSRDALGLARVRDRLIERLVTEGYSAERDLPNFLRAAGHEDRERVQAIQAHADQLHKLSLAWCGESRLREGRPETVLNTSEHYVHLLFAFGLARLGQPVRARELLKNAETAVAARKAVRPGPNEPRTWEVHEFLLKAFRYRIEQALSAR